MIFSCTKASKQFSIIFFCVILIAISFVLLLLEQKRWRDDDWEFKKQSDQNLTLINVYLDQNKIDKIQNVVSVLRIVLTSSLCITIIISFVTIVFQIVHQATKLGSKCAKFSFAVFIFALLGFGLSLFCQFSIIFLEKLQTSEEKWNMILISVFMAVTLLLTCVVIVGVVIYLCISCEKMAYGLNKSETSEKISKPEVPLRIPNGHLAQSQEKSAELESALNGAQSRVSQTLPKMRHSKFIEANGNLIFQHPNRPESI